MFLLDARTARVCWTVLVFAAGVALTYVLRVPILIFVFSLFFAYLIFPLVQLAGSSTSACSSPWPGSASGWGRA